MINVLERSKGVRLKVRNLSFAIAVFLGGCCYGVLATIVKMAYSVGFSPSQVVATQYTIGFILLFITFLFSKKMRVTKKQALKVIVAGIPTGLAGFCYYQSLQSLDASVAIIFLFQFIWIGSLLEWIFLKKRPTIWTIASIIILLIGSLLASGIFQAKQSFPLEGMIWGMLAAFAFAAFIFTSGTVGKELPPIQKSMMLTFGGFLFISFIFPPTFIFDFPTFVSIIPYGFFLGLFGALLPPLLFSIGMPHVGPGLGTILSASELPVALIMASLVLHEAVTLIQWLGACIIFIGIIIGNKSFEKRETNKLRKLA